MLALTGTLSSVCSPPVHPSARSALVDVERLPETDAGLPGEGPIRRYDWFRDLWKQRHAAWSTRIAKDEGAVVFVGDSITQGWGDDMGGSFPGLKVANRGISGDTTRGVLIRIAHDVLRLKPRAVVILAGTNDLDEGASPATIAANMNFIIGELAASRHTMPIILCEVFPSSAIQHRPKERIVAVNRLYAEIARAYPQVTLLPTWALFANDEGDAPPSEFPDLLHPNKAGYDRWAGLLRPALARALGPPARTRPAGPP
jgi:lysophospholipase L1-like esterase